MKLFIEKENALKIDESTELVLLNVSDFVSNIKRASCFVPVGNIEVSLKYKLINNDNEYFGESIFDSYHDISNVIDDNSPYKVELINWKLSDKVEKYLEFNFVKVNSWNERIKYQYRGLECDHAYDVGTYMMWLDLPKGLNYKFRKSDKEDFPYKHPFMAGYMFDEDSEPYFISTITEINVDKYYEYFKPHIKAITI